MKRKEDLGERALREQLSRSRAEKIFKLAEEMGIPIDEAEKIIFKREEVGRISEERVGNILRVRTDFEKVRKATLRQDMLNRYDFMATYWSKDCGLCREYKIQVKSSEAYLKKCLEGKSREYGVGWRKVVGVLSRSGWMVINGGGGNVDEGCAQEWINGQIDEWLLAGGLPLTRAKR